MTRQIKAVIVATSAAIFVALPAIMTAAQVKAPFVLAASAAMAALFAVFAAYWRDSLIELLKVDRTEQTALRDGCVMINGKLPLVRQLIDPTVLGVHPARRLSSSGTPGQKAEVSLDSQPPYVPRDIDVDLRELLAAPGFVLIAGDSTAGKSRTAFEAIAAALPDHTLIAVQDRQVLLSVIARMEQMRHCVLFLDDLEHFLGDGGITRNAVYQLTNGRGHYIVATIRSAELGKYDTTDPGSRIVSRDILATVALARRIDLSRIFSGSEQDRAQTRARQDERIAEALKHVNLFGFAEYLAAGPELMDRWTASREGGEHVRGAALCAAAVDCRRAGLTGPLPRSLLNSLVESYLPVRGGTRAGGEDDEAAWLWATTVWQTTALLTDTGNGDVEVFDYLVDEVSRTAASPVSDVVLRACLDTADTAEIMRVGTTARVHARYQIALDAYAMAHDARNITSGENSEPALEAWGHYAAVLRVMGRLTEAEREHRAVLEARIATLGADDPGTLASRNNLALVLHDLGRLSAAEAEHRIVHEARTRNLGAGHPATLTNRNNLAMVLHDLGQFDEAEQMHCQVLRAYHPLLTTANEAAIAGSVNPAAVLASLGHLEDAEAEHQTVLDTCTRVFGPDRPDALTSKGSPTLVLHAPERLAEAVDMHRSHYEGFRRVLGPDHPTTLTALSNLAVVQHAHGDVEAAESAHGNTVSGFSRVLGRDHPSTLACMSNHAVVLQTLDRIDEAEQEHRQVIAGFRRTFGDDHPSTLTSRSYLASMLFSLGRIDEAAVEQSEVLAGFSPADIAEADFAIAEPIREALSAAVADSDLGYPDFDSAHGGAQRLAAVYAHRMRIKFGMRAAPSRVEICAQIMQALCCVILAFSEPGDRVMVHTPAYPPIIRAIRRLGRRQVLVPIDRSADMVVRSRTAERIAVIVLCNPHNPTGKVLSRDQLTAMAELADQHNAVIFADEAYQDITYEQPHHAVASHDAAAERTITFTSAAKSFNIPGLRCAVGHFGSRSLHRRFLALPWHLRSGAGILGIEATIVAWSSCEPWLDSFRTQLKQNRQHVSQAILTTSCHYSEPQATYFAWFGLHDSGFSHTASFLGKAEKVLMQDGSVYGRGFSRFARLNFAVPGYRLDDILSGVVQILPPPGNPLHSITTNPTSRGLHR
jgi:bifunctional pyridoxal-dependent enzyme with beta-cystathionase and maltose regulon repressor activities